MRTLCCDIDPHHAHATIMGEVDFSRRRSGNDEPCDELLDTATPVKASSELSDQCPASTCDRADRADGDAMLAKSMSTMMIAAAPWIPESNLRHHRDQHLFAAIVVGSFNQQAFATAV